MSANTPPAARRDRERRNVADRRVAQEAREIGIVAGFSSLGTERTPAARGADGHEADVPERDDARVTDEHVERDHERH